MTWCSRIESNMIGLVATKPKISIGIRKMRAKLKNNKTTGNKATPIECINKKVMSVR